MEGKNDYVGHIKASTCVYVIVPYVYYRSCVCIAEIVAEIERTVKASTLCKGEMARPHKGFHTHAGFHTSAIMSGNKRGKTVT